MNTLDELNAIQADFMIEDEDYHFIDRGEMYLRTYMATDSLAAVVEGSISTFSGFVGGTAYLANYILADRSEVGVESYSYTKNPHPTVTDVYEISQAVATDYFATVIGLERSNADSALSIEDGIERAEITWSYDQGINLDNQFPGNAIESTLSIAQLEIPVPDLTNILTGDDGAHAAWSGVIGSILFGKSLSDFSGQSDYQVVSGPDASGFAFYSMQSYVVHINDSITGATSGLQGDRNDDGIIDYQDGTVAMINTEAFDVNSFYWQSTIVPLALSSAVLGNTANPFSAAKISVLTAGLDWNAYRDWDLMQGFRRQLDEGTGNEYDFEVYAKENGGSEAEKDFWKIAEQRLDDHNGLIRNTIYNYERNFTATNDTDYFSGGSADDVIDGGAGDDVLRGGWGNDQFIGGEGSDDIDGEFGDDTVDYSQSVSAISGNLISIGRADIIDEFGDTDTLANIDKIIGTSEDDQFTINTFTNQIIDGRGGDDDRIIGSLQSSYKIIDGTADNQETFYNFAGEKFNTFIDFENIYLDYDRVVADYENNVIYSNSINPNQIPLYAGSILDYSGLSSSITLNDGYYINFDGITHTHVANGGIQGTHNGDVFNLHYGTNIIDIYTGTGNDIVTMPPAWVYETTDIHYSGGNDTYHLTDVAGDIWLSNTILLEDINVTVTSSRLGVFLATLDIANHGKLTLDYDDIWPDTIRVKLKSGGQIDFQSGSSDYTVHGVSQVATTYSGTWGDDIITSRDGYAQTLLGGNGNDLLLGLDESDDLYGQAGDDRLEGGSGDDNLFGGLGSDIALFTGNFADYSVSIESNGNVVVQDNIGTDGIDTLSNVEYLEFNDVRVSIDQTTITPVYGGEVANIINGSDDDDLIFALAGNDIVKGFAGDDVLSGGADGDALEGGQGNDVLFGGQGDDSYAYALGDGHDIIEDDSGFDSIYLGAGITEQDLTFVKNEDDLRIEVGDGSLTVKRFYSADDSAVIEEVNFSDGTTYDLMSLINYPPVAQSDSFTGDTDTNITGNLLADNGNGVDSDPDGGVLTVVAGAFSTSHGSVVISANGDFAYTPDTGYVGVDTFSYTLEDDHGNSSQGHVSLVLNHPEANTVPVGADDSVVTDEDTAIIIDVLANDSDPDNDSLSVSISTNPLNATLVVNADNTITYTPNNNYNGVDSFSYRVDDGRGGTFTSNVTVTVNAINDNPEAHDDVFRARTDTVVVGNVIADNGNGFDYDLDGDAISVIAGTYSTSHGSVVISTNGDFTYTPNTGYAGTDSFTYTLEDANGGSRVGTVMLTLSDTPQNTINGTGSDDTLYGDQTGIANDTLIGGSGVDTLRGGAGDDTYIWNLGDGDDIIDDTSGHDTLVFGSGITQADVTLLRTSDPTSYYNLEINISDGSTINVLSHFVDSQTKKLEEIRFADGTVIDISGDLTLTGTNADDSIESGNTTNDTMYGLAGDDDLSGTGGNDVLIGGAGADTLRGGADDDTYIWNLGDGDDIIDDISGHDTLVFGSGITQADVTLLRTSDPTSYYNLEINISDGSTLSVVGHFIGNQTKKLEEIRFADGTIIDISGDLTLTGTSAADSIESDNTTSDMMYGLAGDDILSGLGGNDVLIGGSGVDTLRGGTGDDTYIWNLGDGDDTIDDTSGHDTLVFGNGISQYDVTLVRGSGPSSYYNLEISVSDGSIISVAGHFIGNQSKKLEEIRFEDGSSINVLAYFNEAPTSKNDVFTIAHDVGFSGNVLADNGFGADIDTDGQAIRVVEGSFSTTHGVVVISANGDFVYTPEAGYAGSDGFTYEVIDELGGVNNATVEITVLPPNVAPIAQDDSFSGDQDVNITGNLLSDNGTGADSDPDGDTLTVIAGTYATANGSVTISANGSFTYTPNAGYFGSDSFTYTLQDDRGGSDSATVTLTLNEVNFAPIAQNDSFSSDQDIDITGNVLADNGNGVDIDPEGHSISVVAETISTANGSVVLSSDGSFVYTPNAGFVGNDSFIYTLTDSLGASSQGTVSLSLVSTSTQYDDVITGTSGNDSLNGSSNSNDLITGLEGNDSLTGYTGNDTYVWSVGDGSDTITEAGGVDQIIMHGVTQNDIRFEKSGNYNLKIHAGTESITINSQFYSDYQNNSYYDIYRVENLVLDDGTTIDLTGGLTFTGTASNDYLYGLKQSDSVLYGLEGNDSIYGYAGNDTLEGGLGNDALNGDTGNDTYVWSVGDGSDTITEAGGVDQIIMHGVTQNDIRFEKSGNYNLKIHVGTESITINSQFYSDYQNNSYYDIYRVENLVLDDGTTIDLTGGLTFTGTSANETINGLNNGNNIFIGLEGNDTLNGKIGNDSYVWSLGDGNDIINETSGVDQIIMHGVTQNDIRFEKSGNYNLKIHVGTESITINSQLYSDYQNNSYYDIYRVENLVLDDGTTIDLTGGLTFTGTASNDYLYGLKQSDSVLYGLEGNDSIYGYAGNDTLEGGLGNDALNGDTGNDTYVWSVGDGNDTITEAGGVDQIIMHGVTQNDIRFEKSGNYNLKIHAGTETITINSQLYSDYQNNSYYDIYRVENLVLDDGTTIDLTGGLTFTGTASNDYLYGLKQSDSVLYGLEGNDSIYGYAGSDILYGGAGSDYLYGGAANDLLYGNAGVDMLYGQGGSDTFVFEAATAFADSDNIQDFKLSENDKLDVSDLLEGYDPLTDALTDFVQITESGSNSYLSVDANGGGDNFIQVAYIYNQTGLTDENALETSGNLITT
ncbi:Ig-like domain-containing protein [Aliikangiella sp. IMCC44359]|uniref:Ig-like domain-containing protein n=1 Tax=Aliikangiella sp. IMCC44359 TaxID=3459125 RepID=UPI00403AE586